MIQIPEIPQIQGQPVNMPTANANAANAPVAALGELARSIGSAGDAFQQRADQIQQIENARLESEHRQTLAAKYADFQIELDKDPDPKNRVPRTRSFFQTEGSAIPQNLPPMVRDRLRNHFDTFATQAVISQAEESAKLALKRASLALDNEIRAATSYNDRPALDLALSNAEEAGLVLPEEKDALISSFERKTNATALEIAIEENPAAIAEELASADFLARHPGITQADIPQLQGAVRASAQRKRSEEMDLIEAALTDNLLQPEDIEDAVYLSPGDRAKVKHAIAAAQADKLPSNEDHAKAWDLLTSLREYRADPATTQEQYRELWNEARGSVLARVAPKWQGDLKKELSYLSPAGRDAQPKISGEYEKGDLEALGRGIAFRARDAGFFGSMDEDATPQEKEKAFRKAEDVRLEVKRWLSTQREPTPEKVREYTDSLISGDRIKSTARELQSFVPGTAQRLRVAPPMPQLPPKQGAKDKETEDPLNIQPGNSGASDALLPARKQLETFINQ